MALNWNLRLPLPRKGKSCRSPFSSSSCLADWESSKFDDIITILVGRTEPPATIFIHRHLITSQSTFFANALRTQPSGAQWSESIESTVSLPDFELEDVELFVEFLFANPVGDWPCEALPLSLRDITNWGLFANAVVLAHYIDAPCFRDALQAALDRTQARYRKRSNVQGVSKLQPKEIDKIWTSTPPGCRARHSIVSMFILQASSVSGISEEGKEMIADLPAEACAYALQISLGIIGRSHVDAWAYSRKEDND